MADRAVNNGEDNVSRDVFQLDGDDRWQARLDEARARREVALAEKAGGKVTKKRLKPWEIDGAAGAKPIEPIIQEREDDRVDFADRVETIRSVSKSTPEPVTAEFPRDHNLAVKAAPPVIVRTEPSETVAEEPAIIPPLAKPTAYKPPAQDDFDQILTALPLPKEARSDVSLIRSDAPDVKDIAARYAATLKPEEAPEEIAEPVVAPVIIVAPAQRHQRPEFLLVAVSLMALLPFAMKAPPLVTGPEVPSISAFTFQPALGVTWSMQEVPVATKSGEWVPRRGFAPVAPIAVEDGTPADYALTVTSSDTLVPGSNAGAVTWAPIPPVSLGQSTKLFQPSLTGPINTDVTNEPPAPLVIPQKAVEQKLPDFRNAPAKPRSPSMTFVKPEVMPVEGRVTTPPIPAPLSPLNVTILSPSTSDKKVATNIAQDLPRRGHKVVRVQEVGYSIKSRNLRFFHEGDRQEAARVAKAYDAELRDFTWYRPKPTEGTTELWLTGRGENPNPVRQARRVKRSSTALQPPAPQRVMPAPGVVQLERKRSLLGALFLGHKPQGGRVNSSDGGGSTQTATTSTGTGTGTGDTGAGTDIVDIDTGGTDTGGTDTGGTDTGGTDTGGTDTGGTDTGGTDPGGTNTGGTDTGGTDTGGTDTGGTDTGGTDTGGTDTGGTDTGGTDTSGGNSNGNGNGNSNGNGNGNGKSD